MKKTLLILTALASLIITSAFGSTLQANAIFADSEEDLQIAIHLSTHNDEAGLEEMDRESKINVFKVPLEVNVYKRGFLTTSFTFPGKTNLLYTASEFIK